MLFKQIQYVRRCISDNDMHRFYIWKPWRRKRKDVLKLDNRECQDCLKKKPKEYIKATHVHHIKEVKKYPELALEIYYMFNGEKKRNLISLCHDCHEIRHGRKKKINEVPLTEEFY